MSKINAVKFMKIVISNQKYSLSMRVFFGSISTKSKANITYPESVLKPQRRASLVPSK